MKSILPTLIQLGMEYELFEHPPLFTTADAHLAPDMPGVKNKNLFLRDSKGERYYLISLTQDKQADLKNISAMLGVKGLSFASPERLMKVLGILPGCVGILSLLHDTEKLTTVYIDQDLLAAEWFQSHPDVNTATVVFRTADLERYLQHTGHGFRPMMLTK
jgi:Ala-tRNA(Pro) deacylase